MNIELTIKDINHKIIEEDTLKWKLYTEINKKIYVVYIVIGLINMPFGILGYEPHGLNIQFSVGIAFFLLTGMYFIQNIIAKSKFYRNTQFRASRYKNSSTEAFIHITDETLRYQDYVVLQEIKWSAFSHYRLYNDYLILKMDNNYLSSIIIDKQCLSDVDFSEVLTFVEKTIGK